VPLRIRHRSHRRGRRVMSEINVVPYIDVMLVLMVIFMITAPLLTEGVKVELPRADARQVEADARREHFIVHVDRGGRLFTNQDNEPSTPQEVRARAAAVLRHNPGALFFVRGDKDAVYESVVRAMVALQQAGAPNVGLITDPRAAGPGPAR